MKKSNNVQSCQRAAVRFMQGLKIKPTEAFVREIIELKRRPVGDSSNRCFPGSGLSFIMFSALLRGEELEMSSDERSNLFSMQFIILWWTLLSATEQGQQQLTL